jgi:AcrR family transcriptional regulator
MVLTGQTPKGAATRARIIETAADLILARGVGATSLNDIRLDTATSKSQLFYYFPGGKTELIAAIAAFQSDRVLDAQRPYLDTLSTWEDWDRWRAAVVSHYAAQPHRGCPIGTLASELAGQDPQLAAELAEHLDRWRSYLEAGVRRMIAGGHLSADADARTLSLAIFAAVQGGLLLTQTMQNIEPLQAALDAALATLRAASNNTTPNADSTRTLSSQ